jgi:hypothetical protein
MFLVKKFHGEKGSVSQCVVLMQQTVLVSPEFGTKPSHVFMPLPENVTVVCRIECLACRTNYL